MTDVTQLQKRMINASTGLGRVVLVTGGASAVGFGHQSAVLMAKHGARVVVTDLAKFEAGGLKVVEEIKAFGGEAAWCPLDVTSEDDYKRAVEFTEKTFGPLDVLLLNAGIGAEFNAYMGPHDSTKTGIWSHPIEDWRRVNGVNLDGVYFGAKAGAKSMVQNNKVPEAKSIIIISSGAGMIGGTGFAYVGREPWITSLHWKPSAELGHRQI